MIDKHMQLCSSHHSQDLKHYHPQNFPLSLCSQPLIPSAFLAGIFLFKKTDKQKNAFRHPPLGDLEVACSMRGTVHVSFFISAFSKPWSGAKFSDLE